MKHLLGTQNLSKNDALFLLDSAEEIANGHVEQLKNKTVANLFFEDSTRTRISFETAQKKLGLGIINFSAKGSSVSKGESLKDTIQTLEAIGIDAIIMRHSAVGAPFQVVNFKWSDVSVINAGDGTHEHPTQALLDAYTLRRHLFTNNKKESLGKNLSGVKILIVGDILHSRVARSNMWLLTTLGAEVCLVAPKTLLPYDTSGWPVKIEHDFDKAISTSPDAVMMLRSQSERQNEVYFPTHEEYMSLWSLTNSRFEALLDSNSSAVIMHPGPMNRGYELSSEVADSCNNLVRDQVASGILVRMAVLETLLKGAL